MNAAHLQKKSCQSDSIVLEITLVATLSSLIVFGALAIIIKMDDDLIIAEFVSQPARLSHREQFQQSLLPCP